MAFQLDKIDRRILFELDQNCRIPETRLAKLVGKSKEAVRYRIKNLREAGIITGYSTHINVGRLGYQGFKIYLKLRTKPTLKHQFIEHLKARPDIYWIGIGDGVWDVGVTFLAKSIDEFYVKKNELYAQYRDIVLSEVNGAMVEGLVFGKKFLLGDENPAHARTAVVFGSSLDAVQIDEVERKILSALLHNGRIKLVELAGLCGSSIEVVRNRIKRLEEQGVIQGYEVDADYQKLGLEFYKTFLYFEGLSPKMHKRIHDMIRRHPNVVHFIKTVAPWAMELEIMAENYHQYNAIISQIRRDLADVLINVESTNVAEDIVFPSKKSIFD